MATYPTDATVDPATFSVVSSWQNTSAVTTDTTAFALPSVAQSRAEVLVSIDGAVQPTTSYTLDGDKGGITFLQAPNPTQSMVIRVISNPDRFLLNRELQDTTGVNFSNGSTTTVNGNNYTINANQESFPLAAASNVTSKDEIFVYVSGVFQDSNSFTYPSVALGTQGIDIGDNVATRLLMNFDVDENGTALVQGANNFVDESYFNSTITPIANANCNTQITRFGSGSLHLDGRSSRLELNKTVVMSNAEIYPILNENFTLEATCNIAKYSDRVNPSSNHTIFSHIQDGYNYYGLEILPNTNVSFRIVHDNVVRTIIGGNVNGEVWYHTAVSYDHDHDNLCLYVNNVLVDSNVLGFSEAIEPTGWSKGVKSIVGASGVSGKGAGIINYFQGYIDSLRISKTLKYTGTSIEPMNTAPTIIGGGALGSVQKNDKLSIRTFGMTVTTLDRFTSMSDRKPDKGYQTDERYDVTTFTSQAGYEKRRLKSRRSKRSYSLTYTNITGVEKLAIENFYRARSGDFETFTFDLSHLNDSGTINTRFNGPLSVTQVLSTGSTLVENFYTVSFALQEGFD